MKIPENAEMVYTGVIYDVYHWEQKLFNGDKKIFEGLKRKPAVQIFAVSEGNIVLLEEKQPGQKSYLSIPGGGVESNDVLACAKRELLEETGLFSEDWILWKKLELGLNIEFDTYYYIAKNCKRKTDPSLDAGEEIKVNWLSLEEFLKAIKGEMNFQNCYLINLIK